MSVNRREIRARPERAAVDPPMRTRVLFGRTLCVESQGRLLGSGVLKCRARFTWRAVHINGGAQPLAGSYGGAQVKSVYGVSPIVSTRSFDSAKLAPVL